MDNRSFDRPPMQSDELPLDLQAAARRYAAQPVPRPTSAETAHLIYVLLTEATFEAQNTPLEGNYHRWQIPVLVRWRLHLLGPWFWIAGVLLLLAGIGLSRSLTVSDLITLLILLLPLAAVFGLASSCC